MSATTQREINTLLHFTRIGNLKNIFRHGLLPRNDKRHGGDSNDKHDNNIDSVCLSITHLSKMFFTMRKENPPENSWCVIELNAAPLDILPCRFYPINAVSKVLRGKNDSEFSGSAAFENMFAPQVEDASGEVWDRHGLENNMTTNQQAEVRVAAAIAPIYFKAVYFHKETSEATIARLELPPELVRQGGFPQRFKRQ